MEDNFSPHQGVESARATVEDLTGFAQPTSLHHLATVRALAELGADVDQPLRTRALDNVTTAGSGYHRWWFALHTMNWMNASATARRQSATQHTAGTMTSPFLLRFNRQLTHTARAAQHTVVTKNPRDKIWNRVSFGSIPLRSISVTGLRARTFYPIV